MASGRSMRRLTMGVAVAFRLVAGVAEGQQVPLGEADRDWEVLEQLTKAGSDLSRVHTPESFLYVPSEAAARAIADRYSESGFTADVHQSPTGQEWTCVLKKSMLLRLDSLRQLRRELTEVARAYGGEYDGWGTEVEN